MSARFRKSDIAVFKQWMEQTDKPGKNNDQIGSLKFAQKHLSFLRHLLRNLSFKATCMETGKILRYLVNVSDKMMKVMKNRKASTNI